MADLRLYGSQPVEIKFTDDETLRLRYKPAALTLALTRQVAEALASADEAVKAAKAEGVTADGAAASSAPDGDAPSVEESERDRAREVLDYSERLRDAILRLVVRWDLTIGDEPVPLTTEGLETVDLSLLRVIWDALVEDQRPDPPSAATSSTP